MEHSKETVKLPRDSNQALGLAQFGIDFMSGKYGVPDAAVLKKVEMFHTDSVLCGLSALAVQTNAPTLLRNEAFEYKSSSKEHKGACVFGSEERIMPEKAAVANCSAVREWDSNGTVFGSNPKLGPKHMAGEFGHNDFYPVVIAACQMKGLDGKTALRAMLLSDEIRGRLAEVFALKNYKIDHVVHGGIASAVVYGALLGATPQQIEAAIGMYVAHYIPWRAIRAGHQLSDSKGASAAIAAEVAMMCVHRAMKGFMGPQDIFRNPEAIFRRFEPQKDGQCPFDLVLTHSGNDFAVMGMHFKLGLYEHQSAGALQGLIDLLRRHRELLTSRIRTIKIVAYQPAFGIIGDPEKRDPRTRQSADHSMVYIFATKLKKAQKLGASLAKDNDAIWKQLMLTPDDYNQKAIFDKETRNLMAKMEFAHGGPEYDKKYPEGIPTSVVITTEDGKSFDSGLVMYPSGHAKASGYNLDDILHHKFKLLGAMSVRDVDGCIKKLTGLQSKSAAEIQSIYNFNILFSQGDFLQSNL
jgi:2-methylcitrate dehydratase